MRYYPEPEKNLGLAGGQRSRSRLRLPITGTGFVQMPPKVYVTLPAGDFRTYAGLPADP